MPHELPSPRPYHRLVPLRPVRLVAPAAFLLLACGPSVEDRGDVYPRNCGVEGPVELFASDSLTYGGDVRRAGEHYLLERWTDRGPGPWYEPMTREHWALDRCGEAQVLLHSGPIDGLRLGSAGEHVLSCDDATGAMAYVDPTGVEPPRPLFPAVEGCRVVPVGQGLAAQERGGGTVWFHPDPSDAAQEVQVVTSEAMPARADWVECWDQELDCESWHPFGLDIRAAGDDLLVALESEELLAFSSTSLDSRILDPEPVFAIDVLSDERHVVARRDLGPTLIIDRHDGDAFEFCCWSDLFPIELFGDWLVQGSIGSPVFPEPPAWTNFEARHMPSGGVTVVEGRDSWNPMARITSDTMLVGIRPAGTSEYERYVVSLTTGERHHVDLPDGDAWSVPGRDGVYVLEWLESGSNTLHHLAGPEEEPRVLLVDVHVLFATEHGRIVFMPAHEPGAPAPLSVMLPEGRTVVLEEAALGAVSSPPYVEPWPLARDEVVYSVQDGDGWALKRTVLP